ncbi:hypothetical protein Tco_1313053 [Tanacetum coccineum]
MASRNAPGPGPFSSVNKAIILLDNESIVTAIDSQTPVLPLADLKSQTSALKHSALTGHVPSMMRDLRFLAFWHKRAYSPQVVNPMHESGDPHALRGSLHESGLHLESFHELFDGLSVPLLDIVDFNEIFNVLLLLHDVCKKAALRSLYHLSLRANHTPCGPPIRGTAKSSSSVDLCLFDFDFQCPSSLVPISDTRDNADSLPLPLFTITDIVQLEDAVSTISGEYLLEFTSEYGIPEDLHPELPGPEDTIVDFPEGKVEMDLFNLISAPNPAKVKTGTRPRAAHEVPLLTATANRVIDMEDITEASGSSGTPSTVEKSPLDFTDEDLPSPNNEGVRTKGQIHDEVSHGVPSLENPPTTEVVLESKLEHEVAAIGPLIHKRRRKRGNDKADANAPPKVLRKDHVAFCLAQSTIEGKSLATIGKATSSTIILAAQDTPAGASSVKDPEPLSYAEPRPIPEQDIAQSFKKTLRLRFEQEAKLLKKSVAQVARRDQKIEAKEKQIQNLEALLEEGYHAREDAQVTGEERIKAAFEEFKKYEDERVNSRVINHGLRLAVMKCAESSEIRRAFADVVSAGLAKDLKYPMVDQLEKLRDAPMELIMSSLHLESDTGEDAPQWIRDLRPSTSQLKIPVYPEVRNPRDPWAIKEEILLEDAIAANVSRAEKKKKKCRVVCRTHGVSSAHHTRSDGVPVSAPTVAILLADASTQTEISKGEASPRLLRSMYLPAMYNLDWP